MYWESRVKSSICMNENGLVINEKELRFRDFIADIKPDTVDYGMKLTYEMES